jgi:aspartyl/asparaginyl beta-hydroxylase (cupin superfamily)
MEDVMIAEIKELQKSTECETRTSSEVNISLITENEIVGTKSSSKKRSTKFDDINFYKTSDYPQLKLFDANYLAIKEELLSITNQENENDRFFEPWVEKDLYEESNPDGWHIAPLMINGNLIEKNCLKAKYLYGLIKEIPQLVSVSFSLLKPNTHIVPHKGYDEYSEEILRYHLGLIIPKGDLGIRVNTDIRVWKEGESFVFDDYKIHEAWNFSDSNRYVLICDFIGSDFDRKINSEDINFKDRKFNDSISNYI